MQVSAQPRSWPSGPRYLSAGTDPVSSIDAAIEQSAGRGGRPGGFNREGQQAPPDPRTEKIGHKTVFLARALSSTLTQLQIASSAPEFAEWSDMPNASSRTAFDKPASLDDLLSSFLSAA